MPEAVAALLPAAIGVATSPIPVIAVVLVLATPRAATNGPVFAVSWLLGLAVATALALLLVSGGEAGDGAGPAAGWVQVVAGVVFLGLAVKTWRGRPAPGAEPELPGWMATIDGLGASRIAGLGVLLSAANPKNLALAFAAVSAIRETGVDDDVAVTAALVFVAVGSSTVVVAVLAHLVAAERAATVLTSVRRFMVAHNTAIALVILVLLGAKFLADGIVAVTA